MNYFKVVNQVVHDKKDKVVKAYLENDPGLDQFSWYLEE